MVHIRKYLWVRETSPFIYEQMFVRSFAIPQDKLAQTRRRAAHEYALLFWGGRSPRKGLKLCTNYHHHIFTLFLGYIYIQDIIHIRLRQHLNNRTGCYQRQRFANKAQTLSNSNKLRIRCRASNPLNVAWLTLQATYACYGLLSIFYVGMWEKPQIRDAMCIKRF